MLGQFEMEELGVQPAHRDRGGTGGNGDPERTQHAAAVALLDVLPAQVQPQFPTAEPVDQIFARPVERLGLRGGIGECHWFFLPSAPEELFASPKSAQPQPLPKAGRIASRNQEEPAEPQPLLR